MFFKGFKINKALVVHSDMFDNEAFTRGEGASSCKNAFVLDCANQNASAAGQGTTCQTQQGKVVGFCRPGCENDLITVCANQSGNDECRTALVSLIRHI